MVQRRSSANSIVSAMAAFLALIPVASGQSEQPPAEPWPVALGLRVATIERRAPVEDRVVLVPDEATFLDELSRWSPKARWPILIEDDIYAPMFVRAFAPKRIVRRTDRIAAAKDPAALKTAIDRAVIRAFGGDPNSQSPAQAMEAARMSPTGIAAYTHADAAFVAAAALAAGHGMLPMQLDGNFGAPNDRMDAATFGKLDGVVSGLFEAAQLPFQSMGDTLDALVLCRATALQATPDLPPDRIPALPGVPAVKPGEPVATTDALCRGPNGQRYAVAGSIFGSGARSAYAAMCSLFLARTSLLTVDCYGDVQQFAAYGLSGISDGLGQAGFQVTECVGTEARLPAWRDRLLAGFNTDLLFMNTSGNAEFFDLGVPGQTTAANRGGPGDIPVLSKPLALHLIHSFSQQQPANRETLGGRWLEAGVYAYVGSVHEPYLPAFVQPRQVLERLINAVPFAVAARQWDGPFALPWRVQVLGDPLMLCAAPKGIPIAERIPPTPLLPGEQDVFAACKSALERTKNDRDGAATALAIRELVLVGRDAAAAQLWSICAAQPWSTRVAPTALEPLFRQHDPDGFLKAYALTPEPTPRQRDMLWQIWGERLDRLKDPESFILFERAVRATWPSMDWQRLLPAMSKVCGQARASAALLKAIDSTQNPQQRAALQDLLKQG
ncbi:MAG: hypothetical protein ACOYMI_02600 [Phycisphaerales bacterium]